MKCKVHSKMGLRTVIVTLIVAAAIFFGFNESKAKSARRQISIVDASGRSVTVPASPRHVICSGPGCLRYLTYLQAHHTVAAVDDIETKRQRFDARPYALANPQLKSCPIFGQFRGYDSPELIAALDPQPQIIFKTFGSSGHDPIELQQKTGIPVIVLNYGDLTANREAMYASLRTMGKVMGKTDRAETVIGFFNSTIEDLEKRTDGLPDIRRRSCYVGGIAYRGPHGFQSTEPGYPPFLFTRSRNVVAEPEQGQKALSHATVAKEKIMEWDPEVLFVDLSTLQSDARFNAILELQKDLAYRQLNAVKTGEVYGVLPYNWYAQNYGSTLADAYFVGKVLYPERFTDIDPVKQADKIFSFLVGRPVFDQMNAAFDSKIFQRLALQELGK